MKTNAIDNGFIWGIYLALRLLHVLGYFIAAYFEAENIVSGFS